MKELPGVTVIIPTYNQAEFIVKTVESALAQTYAHLKVVVADDCSTDTTQQVLEPFISAGKISYFKNPANLGRVGNYKKALQDYAQTDWVINLDGDDHYTNPQYIESAMQEIISIGINQVVMFQGTHVRLSPNNVTTYYPRINTNQATFTSLAYFYNYCKINYFSHMSTIYNRQLALQCQGFYGVNVLSADVFSILKLCLLNLDKQVILSKNISGAWVHHQSNASKSNQFTTHFRNYLIYPALFKIGLQQRLSPFRMIGWLTRVTFNYVKMYAGMLIRGVKFNLSK